VGAQGFVVRGDFYRRGALMDRALEQYQRAEGIYQAVGDLRGVADCWSARGLVEAERGNYPAALWQYSGAEAIFRQIDEPKYLGWCLFNQGAAYRNLSRWDDAKRCIMEALEIRRQLGDAPGVARCLSVLAAIHKDAGDAEAALACLKEEIEIYKEWEDSEGLATNVSRQVSLLKGPWARPEEANALIEDILEWTVREGRDDLAEEICRASGSLNRLAGHLLKLAGEREQNEDFGGALKSLTDHLRICRELGDGEGILAGFGRHIFLLRGVCQKPREAESIVRAVVKWAMHEGKIEWVPRICREAGPLEVLIPVLCDRGDFLASSDRREDALLLYGEAEKICRQLGLDEALRNCLDKKAAASKADQPR
jgi:tetratricopeptide (TPR) repeat protein